VLAGAPSRRGVLLLMAALGVMIMGPRFGAWVAARAHLGIAHVPEGRPVFKTLTVH